MGRTSAYRETGMTATMLGREIPGSDSTITQDDIDYLARMHEFEDFYESYCIRM